MRKQAEAFQNYNAAAVVELFTGMLPKLARAVSALLAKTDKMVVINSDGEGGGAPKAHFRRGQAECQPSRVIQGRLKQIPVLASKFNSIRPSTVSLHSFQSGTPTKHIYTRIRNALLLDVAREVDSNARAPCQAGFLEARHERAREQRSGRARTRHAQQIASQPARHADSDTPSNRIPFRFGGHPPQ